MSVKDEYEMQCPMCGKDDRLKVDAVIHTTVLLCEDGVDDPGGDTEWDRNSGCYCDHCNWQGKVGDAQRAYVSRSIQTEKDALA
jgi:hypothetical protein